MAGYYEALAQGQASGQAGRVVPSGGGKGPITYKFVPSGSSTGGGAGGSVSASGSAADVNTGGGGGGGGYTVGNSRPGGAWGSGIVIIRDLVAIPSALAGTLVLSGAVSNFGLSLSKFFGGTLDLSGILDLKLSLFRFLSGTLAFSRALDYYKRIPQALAGALNLGGAISDMKLSLTRFMAGTLTFSSTIASRFLRFVVGAVRLCLKPVAIVRTWLDPDADVDIV